MKLSVSLPDEDVEFIDQYATAHAVDSRSGVLKRALSLLRASELGEDYAAAWGEWESSDGDVWETTIADGISESA
ncbi:MAG: ribbon-helix-helix domain-containing protein [Acidimicrobiia bacterium]